MERGMKHKKHTLANEGEREEGSVESSADHDDDDGNLIDEGSLDLIICHVCLQRRLINIKKNKVKN